jgi:SAM-dependent methyltransferase
MAAAETYYQFEDINNAIIRLFREAVRNGETVLDLGCGRARLGLEVERLGYKVTGIDNNPVACEMARSRISQVFECDLADRESVATALGGLKFDWLMAADVLEHSPDPQGALSFYKGFLKPSGRLVLSLPNVAVWDSRLRLFFGRFDYQDSGVMDRTHLRFFTFRSARKLVTECGFTIRRVASEPGIARAFLPLLKAATNGHGSPGAILDSPVYHFYSRYLLPIESAVCRVMPGLFAFRAVILAERHD